MLEKLSATFRVSVIKDAEDRTSGQFAFTTKLTIEEEISVNSKELMALLKSDFKIRSRRKIIGYYMDQGLRVKGFEKL